MSEIKGEYQSARFEVRIDSFVEYQAVLYLFLVFCNVGTCNTSLEPHTAKDNFEYEHP